MSTLRETETKLRAQLAAAQHDGNQRLAGDLAHQIQTCQIRQVNALEAERSDGIVAADRKRSADATAAAAAATAAETNPYRVTYDGLSKNPIAQASYAARYADLIFPAGGAA
jgi:hypothetical protein